MALYFIGMGLHDAKDISLKGLEIVKRCDYVYYEYYTGKLNSAIDELEKLYGKKLILADRELVEKRCEETILKHAIGSDVALLVVGDPMSATTHIDLMLRAKEMRIKTIVVNNASVITAVGITGLQVYKFGKTTSIPYPEENFKPHTAYDVIKLNKNNGLHTLILLDLRPLEDRYMSVNEAIQILLDIEKERNEQVFNENTKVIGCARLGSLNPTIISGKAEDVKNKDFGSPVHCLIVPGKMHFIEEEAFKLWEC